MKIGTKTDHVYERLRNDILSRKLAPGIKLPRETEFARKLGVGQVTLRSALKLLQKENLVQRIHGRGTFVASQGKFKALVVLPDRQETLEASSRYIVPGIEELAGKSGIKLEKCSASVLTSMTESESERMFQEQAFDGVILETGRAEVPEDLRKILQAVKLPVVIPHGGPSDNSETGFAVLRTDEKAAFSTAIRYFAAHDHRSLGCIFVKVPDEDQRLMRGFTRAELEDFLRQNGFDVRPELIAHVELDAEIIKAAAIKMLTAKNPPSALLCHSDRMALHIYDLFRELNVKIPEQISIMGYSNYPGTQLLSPPLTTIDVYYRECGARALQLLLDSSDWFGKDKKAPEIFTPFHLLERLSVTRPAQPAIRRKNIRKGTRNENPKIHAY